MTDFNSHLKNAGRSCEVTTTIFDLDNIVDCEPHPERPSGVETLVRLTLPNDPLLGVPMPVPAALARRHSNEQVPSTAQHSGTPELCAALEENDGRPRYTGDPITVCISNIMPAQPAAHIRIEAVKESTSANIKVPTIISPVQHLTKITEIKENAKLTDDDAPEDPGQTAQFSSDTKVYIVPVVKASDSTPVEPFDRCRPERASCRRRSSNRSSNNSIDKGDPIENIIEVVQEVAERRASRRSSDLANEEQRKRAGGRRVGAMACCCVASTDAKTRIRPVQQFPVEKTFAKPADDVISIEFATQLPYSGEEFRVSSCPKRRSPGNAQTLRYREDTGLSELGPQRSHKETSHSTTRIYEIPSTSSQSSIDIRVNVEFESTGSTEVTLNLIDKGIQPNPKAPAILHIPGKLEFTPDGLREKRYHKVYERTTTVGQVVEERDLESNSPEAESRPSKTTDSTESEEAAQLFAHHELKGEIGRYLSQKARSSIDLPPTEITDEVIDKIFSGITTSTSPSSTIPRLNADSPIAHTEFGSVIVDLNQTQSTESPYSTFERKNQGYTPFHRRVKSPTDNASDLSDSPNGSFRSVTPEDRRTYKIVNVSSTERSAVPLEQVSIVADVVAPKTNRNSKEIVELVYDLSQLRRPKLSKIMLEQKRPESYTELDIERVAAGLCVVTGKAPVTGRCECIYCDDVRALLPPSSAADEPSEPSFPVKSQPAGSFIVQHKATDPVDIDLESVFHNPAPIAEGCHKILEPSTIERSKSDLGFFSNVTAQPEPKKVVDPSTFDAVIDLDHVFNPHLVPPVPKRRKSLSSASDERPTEPWHKTSAVSAQFDGVEEPHEDTIIVPPTPRRRLSLIVREEAAQPSTSDISIDHVFNSSSHQEHTEDKECLCTACCDSKLPPEEILKKQREFANRRSLSSLSATPQMPRRRVATVDIDLEHVFSPSKSDSLATQDDDTEEAVSRAGAVSVAESVVDEVFDELASRTQSRADEQPLGDQVPGEDSFLWQLVQTDSPEYHDRLARIRERKYLESQAMSSRGPTPPSPHQPRRKLPSLKELLKETEDETPRDPALDLSFIGDIVQIQTQTHELTSALRSVDQPAYHPEVQELDLSKDIHLLTQKDDDVRERLVESVPVEVEASKVAELRTSSSSPSSTHSRASLNLEHVFAPLSKRPEDYLEESVQATRTIEQTQVYTTPHWHRAPTPVIEPPRVVAARMSNLEADDIDLEDVFNPRPHIIPSEPYATGHADSIDIDPHPHAAAAARASPELDEESEARDHSSSAQYIESILGPKPEPPTEITEVVRKISRTNWVPTEGSHSASASSSRKTSTVGLSVGLGFSNSAAPPKPPRQHYIEKSTTSHWLHTEEAAAPSSSSYTFTSSITKEAPMIESIISMNSTSQDPNSSYDALSADEEPYEEFHEETIVTSTSRILPPAHNDDIINLVFAPQPSSMGRLNGETVEKKRRLDDSPNKVTEKIDIESRRNEVQHSAQSRPSDEELLEVEVGDEFFVVKGSYSLAIARTDPLGKLLTQLQSHSNGGNCSFADMASLDFSLAPKLRKLLYSCLREKKQHKSFPSLSTRAQALLADSDDICAVVYQKMRADRFDPATNRRGNVNLCTAENNVCEDLIEERLKTLDSNSEALLHYGPSGGSLATRQSLLRYFLRFMDAQKVVVDDILLTPGANAAYDLLTFATMDSDEILLTNSPIYARILCNVNERCDCTFLTVPFKDYMHPTIDLADMERRIANAADEGNAVRAIVVLNPHNPLGVVFDEEEMTSLCNWASEHGLFVIVDEVFSGCVYGASKFRPFLSYRHKLRSPQTTAFIWSPSKDFGLPGIRISSVVCSDPGMKKLFLRLESLQPTSALAQTFCLKLLDDPEWITSFHRLKLDRLRAHQSLLAENLALLQVPFAPAVAGVTCFCDFSRFIPSRFPTDDALVAALAEVGVFVHSGRTMGSDQPGWLRIVFACKKDELQEGMTRLVRFLGNDETYTSRPVVYALEGATA